MNRSKYIYQKASKIAKKAGTRNPKQIAKELGISVYLNNELNELLVMYTVVKRKRAIIMNSRLEEYMFRMILAHEIGHDIMHREEAKNSALQEFELFDINNALEYEANVFAAHLLLDTDDILEYAHQGKDVASIARMMCVNINLVLIKINKMVAMGYDLRMPMDAKKNFLKDIKA